MAPDVACFQEMDRYDEVWATEMKKMGYQSTSVLAERDSSTPRPHRGAQGAVAHALALTHSHSLSTRATQRKHTQM